MKKILLTFIFLASFSLSANAEWQVAEVAESSITVHIVTVSSGVASQVDIDSITMSQRQVAEFQNIDSSAALWCSERPQVTVNNGRLIAANGGTGVLNIAARSSSDRLTIWCITDASAGGTKLALTQAY